MHAGAPAAVSGPSGGEPPLDRLCWDHCPSGEPVVLFFLVKEFSQEERCLKEIPVSALKLEKLLLRPRYRDASAQKQSDLYPSVKPLNGRGEQTGEGSLAVPSIQTMGGTHSRVTHVVCVEGKGKN